MIFECDANPDVRRTATGPTCPPTPRRGPETDLDGHRDRPRRTSATSRRRATSASATSTRPACIGGVTNAVNAAGVGCSGSRRRARGRTRPGRPHVDTAVDELHDHQLPDRSQHDRPRRRVHASSPSGVAAVPTAYTDATCTPGTSCSYKIRAFYYVGQSPDSNVATATAPVDTPLTITTPVANERVGSSHSDARAVARRGPRATPPPSRSSIYAGPTAARCAAANAGTQRAWGPPGPSTRPHWRTARSPRRPSRRTTYRPR